MQESRRALFVLVRYERYEKHIDLHAKCYIANILNFSLLDSGRISPSSPPTLRHEECEQNKEWMEARCGPACQACDKLDIRRRCPPLGDDAIPALMPGELNRMFERIVRTQSKSNAIEDGTVNYTVRVHSRPEPNDGGGGGGESINFWTDVASPPWVIALDDFLNEEERDHLTRLGDTIGYNPIVTQQRAGKV